ncbi:uncharacterized protein VTP21DRAFT_9552 [Calcarisporiella thermophila]|uniref:uncharacterized protein n=1 Tax=Calcarisporiella thermophila TaxID=911321 RepID=UPI0037441F20
MKALRLISIVLLALLPPSSASLYPRALQKRDYQQRDYYALELHPDASPAKVARSLGLAWEGQIGELENHHLYSISKEREFEMSKKREDIGVLWFEKQIPRRRHKRGPIPPLPVEMDLQTCQRNQLEKRKKPGDRPGVAAVAAELGIADPGFGEQWHLINELEPGNDINVTGAWRGGNFGANVVVAIVDDGLDMYSDDLKDNFFEPGSFDFNDHTKLPQPRLIDDLHGTRCAGEIAAVKNDVCGVGVAFKAKVAGIRILSGDITDADEALALNYGYQENHIYSCSWGPPDNGEAVEAPQGMVLKAMVNGIEKGRGGKGNIFVFASGNGGGFFDNCNFDGYTNSRYTITIGAIDRMNNHPYYSEKCAAQLAVTYSSGSGSYIYTSDVGKKMCSDRHGGTSAAAPLAAGVLALVLSERPDLTWRDVQHLLVQTAVPISLDEDDWEKTAAGRLFNHKFGYGKVDAGRIVEAAKTFKNVGPNVQLEKPVMEVDMAIPENEVGLMTGVEVTEEEVKKAQLGRLEHVTVTVNVEHQRRGDIEVYLISPAGVSSQLATRRRWDTSSEGLKNWTFMTVKHWEENPVGKWSLKIVDQYNPHHSGKLVDWRISFFGEQSPNASTPVQPSASPSLDVIPVAPSDEPTVGPPTTSSTAAAAATTTTSASPTPTTPQTPDQSPTPASHDTLSQTASPSTSLATTASTLAAEAQESSTSNPYIDAYGASATSRAILYIITGALFAGVVVGFVYYGRQWWQERKKGGARDNYEFSVLVDQQDDREARRPLRDKREEEEERELYDAFGDSDDDNDEDVDREMNGYEKRGRMNGTGGEVVFDHEGVLDDDEEEEEVEEEEERREREGDNDSMEEGFQGRD